ncbi:hypothetical protein F2P56_019048 [Juglans regia]|uniref:Salicylate carboxymethyltransferase-like n=2 Tax=Juglans regia TaxID=51240 RepID=A0A6P9F0K4_JUGRE|nr:salicylate carboxymethyltransferase-like [Juglans regia]KAF5463107.1 hypothetical protein F2P56_019048 [Juglans regia]
MEVGQVLHMNAGTGETSYSNNSHLQKKVISMTMPIIEEAMTNLYSSTLPSSLVIADLGCSSGHNSLFVVSELIKIVEKLRQKSGHQSLEIQVLLNDLPGNDFNTIFKSLPSIQKNLSNQLEAKDAGPYFFSGVPGSFYGRLFMKKSLHFLHSSYSLHWLSQVPEQIENNKRNIYIASTSPPNVPKAYSSQFQRDFSTFLKCRAEEMVTGGRMVLTFMGRKSEDPTNKDGSNSMWEFLAMALNDMVSKGVIKEEKMDSFNIPHYTPSLSEVKCEILEEGSFLIDRLELSEINRSTYYKEYNHSNISEIAANSIRAVAESLLVSHFGDGIIEKVFSKYKEILSENISQDQILLGITNLIISVTKK